MTELSAKDPERLDWFEMYPEKFLGGAWRMTFEQRSIYALILFLIYAAPRGRYDDRVPADTAKAMGCSTTLWNRTRAYLVAEGKIEVTEGFITNAKATAYFKEKLPLVVNNRQKIVEKKQKETAEKTAKKTPEKNQGKPVQGVMDVDPPPNVPYARARESESELEKEGLTTGQIMLAVEEIAQALNQPWGKYWEADYKRMRLAGISKEAILEAAKGHRGDPIRKLSRLEGLAKRKQEDLDWKAKAERPGGIVGATITSASHTEKEWEIALGALLRIGNWQASAYGIVPTRPGHVVPPGPYAKWLALWEAQGSHPLREGDTSGNIVPYPADRVSPMLRALWEPIAT